MNDKIRAYFTGQLKLGVSQAMAVEHGRMEEIYNEVEDLKSKLRKSTDRLWDIRNMSNTLYQEIDEFVEELDKPVTKTFLEKAIVCTDEQ